MLVLSVWTAARADDNVTRGADPACADETALPFEMPEGLTHTDSTRRAELAAAMAAQTPEWSTAELNGKLHMDGLPLSPSVKIFIERDQRVSVSVRAPFLGEVGRIEVNQDSIMAVNKMAKAYCAVRLEDRGLPVGLDQLQGLLLGYISLPGIGQLDTETAAVTEMYEYVTGETLVLPGAEIATDGASYGFVTDPEQRLSEIIVSIANDTQDMVTAVYERKGDQTAIDIEAAIGDRVYPATLQLQAPKWNTAGFEPIQINPRYKRLSFADFIKSF